MDLKIKDVAELFDVSENTIRRWISDGKIPAYRMNQLHQDYRFSVGEMENWLMSHKLSKNKEEAEKEKKSGGSKQFSLLRAIHKGDVYHNIPGKTKEDVIRSAVKKMAKTHPIDADVITELLLDREKLMPTALNNGIGVPHTRDTLHDARHDVILIVFPEEQLHYGALDNKPVHTLFFLFACEDKRHLHLLAKIAHLSSQDHALEFFQKRPSKEKLLDFVKTWEGDF